jgi:hypothetical protein
MLYGTAEFRKNFYIKLRQMTGNIFRAPGRIDATRVHARASAKRAMGVRCPLWVKADMCSAKRHVRFIDHENTNPTICDQWHSGGAH